MAIPKIIHYCWIGGEYPELVRKCIDSWKTKLPDYQIICWNTDNFDVNMCKYVSEAYEAKKYAFVSDYIRLYALYTCGGIYMDTDVEVVKRFDDLLNEEAVFGFENNHTITTSFLASKKENPLIKKLLDYYSDIHFQLDEGKYDMTPNTVFVTRLLKEEGLRLDGTEQSLKYGHIYPVDFFCPYTRATETLNITDNTYSIHYFNGTWISDEKKRIIEKRKSVICKYGKGVGYIYYGLAVLKTQGLKQFWNEMKFFMK